MRAQDIDRLTERERQCLRLVDRSFTTKEIARQIGVTDLRAQKIIESAIHKLGVSRRTEAARLLTAYENRGVVVPPGGSPTLPAPTEIAPIAADEEARQPPTLREERSPYEAGDLAEFGLPLRRRGGTRNDLTTWQRAVWIALISAAALIGIGALATGLGSLSDRIILVPQ